MSMIQTASSSLTALVAFAVLGCSDGSPGLTDPDPVRSITITPAVAEVALGETLDLHATVTGEEGQPVTREVSWSSSDTSVVIVNADGRVIPIRAGTANAIARVDAVSASVEVQVPIPTELLGTLTLYQTGNGPLPAVVFAEHLPEGGFLEIVALTGWMRIDAGGTYEQKVQHASYLDGAFAGVAMSSDRGTCEVAVTELSCGSTLFQNRGFSATRIPGGVRTLQDFEEDPLFPRPMTYDFAQMHLP